MISPAALGRIKGSDLVYMITISDGHRLYQSPHLRSPS